MSAAKLNRKNRKDKFIRPVLIKPRIKNQGIYHISSCREKIFK